ncbi:ABC transporter A family member 8 [Acorus gramineus]|uniref:ABC transporter A family member 8 n=1 Tax=Acorus gramineus TaxID=55184 RepID=A0AAV9A232_ACOGR|nr:ABC transporter A family member 8 [Acorus gramineus]
MMKIHGISDRAYWMVTYTYFLAISSLYMVWFTAIGSTIGLDIFLLNSYGIQFVFYLLLYLNLQISLAFLAATGFSEVKIASVVAYIYVFGCGLLGVYLIQYYIEDTTLPRWQLLTMDLMPGFSLYKGLYEFSQCALAGHNTESYGMTWKDLNNTNNGMKDILLIMALECPILICISYDMDKIFHLSNKVFKQWKCFWKKRTQPFTMSNRIQSSAVFFDSENSEVYNERWRVEQLIQDIKKDHPFVCNNLGKRYMGKDGRLKKQALQSLYLAIQSGECFGMLGPSGSGKSTFINMVSVNIFYLFQTFHGTTFSLMLILTLRASMNNALSNELSTYQMKT